MPSEFRRQDFYMGLIFCAVSLGVIAESWRMPRDLLGWPAYAGPGVVTGLLGLGLLVMGLALSLRSVGRPGTPLHFRAADLRAYLADPGTRRLGLMLGLSAAYCALLGRNLPYWLTTAAYLAVTMFLFQAARWWQILLIAGGTAAAVGAVFGRIFALPLP
jgi:hypothetical protein